MALVDVIFRSTKGRTVGTVVFDCVVSETHVRECNVTEHAVEESADVADHIRLKPDSVDLVGIVSDTPIVMFASLGASSPVTTDFISPPDRAKTANRELDRIMADGEILEVITSLKEYSNMAIVSKSVSREAGSGAILDCSISLREIIKATTKTVSLPTPSDAAKKGTSDAGTKNKKETSGSNSSKSTSILGSLF